MSVDDTIKKMEENLQKKRDEKAARDQKKIDTLTAKVKAKAEKRALLSAEIDSLQAQIDLLKPPVEEETTFDPEEDKESAKE